MQEMNYISNRDLNSLAPGRCGSNVKSVFSEHMLRIKFMRISCKIAFMWMLQNILEDM